MTCA